MERLRQLLTQIMQQMSVLSVSQRVAIGLCAALAAFSVLWLVQWSTTPQMVPLVGTDFTYDSLDAAEAALKTSGIDYQVVGTRFLVKPADRYNALRVVYAANALPEGSLFDMASVVNDPNPFQSPEARDYAQNYAKGNELAKIIATYPFVRKASVLLNPKSKRRLGQPGDEPSASVAITLASNQEMTHEMVDGFAKLVAGSVSGLKPHRVNITDSRTGRSFSVPHPDDALGFDYLSEVKQREMHLLTKIQTQLAHIPGVQAQVTVELDTSKKVKQKQVHDAPQPRIETTNSNEQNSGGGSGEPGVQANVGSAVAGASEGQSQSQEETHIENFEPKLLETETVEQGPLTTKRVTATVSLPRSFIVGLLTAQDAETQNPKDDDPKYIAVRKEQLERVKMAVEKIVMAKNPDDVQVDVHPDLRWSPNGGSWAQSPTEVASIVDVASPTDTMGLLKDYGPVAGLGTLAVMSLFMMLRIVRQSSDEAARRSPMVGEFMEDEPMLAVGTGTVGQAAVSESFLAGREVDERTLRYQELGTEVTKMVEGDPRGAATLLRQWVEEQS